MSDLMNPDLEALGTTLLSMFEIPVYQRPYKWEKDQIEDLFDDIMDEYSRGEDTSNGQFFLGTFFLSNKGNVQTSTTVYEVIDGQQRITTIALILLVLYSRLHTILENPESDADLNQIKKILWKKKGKNFNKEWRLIKSGELERNALENVFNWCFDDPKDFLKRVKDASKEKNNFFATNFYNNIEHITDCIDNKVLTCESKDMQGATAEDKLILFFNYLVESTCVITITLNNGVNNDRKKLFEIFESINSKGRQLDEIDLIKSYIFQNIPVEDYDSYLEKWGELIKKTKDNLSEYLGIFINAKIKFYKNTMNVKTFRSFSNDADKGLKGYYESTDIGETLKRFIDEMVMCVDNYVKLTEDNQYLINSDEFKFYTEVMRDFNYSHPKALLFRVYCDFNNQSVNIHKPELINLTRNAVTFMVLFQTLQEKDSRETAGKFESFMKIIYENRMDYYSKLVEKIKYELKLSGITTNKIHSMLMNHVGYEQNAKKETKYLLSAFVGYDGSKFAFDKMTSIFKEKDIQVDHIAARRPDSNDSNYSYHVVKDSNDREVVRLDASSDYLEANNVSDGMDYDLFLANTLNKTGNLQLMWKSKNQEKSNGVKILPDYQNFTSYKEIEDRAKTIADTLCNSKFFEIVKK